ncbi:hypothetical protein ACFLV7_15780 [Chloroflexota bacterium]
MYEFDFDEYQGKTVVLIGGLVQEGVTTKIKTLGYAYKQKILVSSTPKNWIAAKELLSDLRLSERLVAVFIHLTQGLIFKCNESLYSLEWQDLVDEILRNKSVFFVYEDNLAGKFAHDPWSTANNKTIESANEFIRDLYASNANIIPYRKRVDLTLNIQEFLDWHEQGIILRLYVPNRQYQEDQLDSFLRLLENYLQNIEKVSFSVDVRKTEQGHVYEFKSKNDIQSLTDFNEATKRFEAFMELCQNDPNQARSILKNISISQTDLEFLISKYVREYKRLKLDIRHEYEQKTLAIKHHLESDILEGEFRSINGNIRPTTPISLLSIPNNLGAVNVSIGQIFYGNITYSAEDRQLIELFEKYADKLEAISLKSSLDELKDTSSPKEKRQTAKQKIASFLYKIASIVGESVVKGLAEYLEKKVTSGL